MKKILMVLMSTLLLTGCVSQTTTVTIDGSSSATIEKKFSFGAASTTMSTDKLSMAAGDKFLESVRKQNPESILRYKTETDSGYVAVIKKENITKEDIFANESFFKAKNKKNLDCKAAKNRTECSANFVVNIKSPELDKILQENGLKYEELSPYTLTIKLPVKAESHNAKFFDLTNNLYTWEIPAGVETPVKLDFVIK